MEARFHGLIPLARLAAIYLVLAADSRIVVRAWVRFAAPVTTVLLALPRSHFRAFGASGSTSSTCRYCLVSLLRAQETRSSVSLLIDTRRGDICVATPSGTG
jgi:hypothetical protein